MDRLGELELRVKVLEAVLLDHLTDVKTHEHAAAQEAPGPEAPANAFTEAAKKKD